MTTKEKLLAAKLLQQASVTYEVHDCNDFEFTADWTTNEIKQFVAEYHSWNGEPWKFTNPSSLHLPDFAVMAFLASKLALEAKIDEQIAKLPNQ